MHDEDIIKIFTNISLEGGLVSTYFIQSVEYIDYAESADILAI